MKKNLLLFILAFIGITAASAQGTVSTVPATLNANEQGKNYFLRLHHHRLSTTTRAMYTYTSVLSTAPHGTMFLPIGTKISRNAA